MHSVCSGYLVVREVGDSDEQGMEGETEDGGRVGFRLSGPAQETPTHVPPRWANDGAGGKRPHDRMGADKHIGKGITALPV